MKKIFLVTAVAGLSLPNITFAHCPLCTAGAGALAVLAAYYGVSSAIVGLLIGAFASVLAIYISRIIKKKYFRLQNFAIISLVYLSTVIPIAPLVREFKGLYVSMFGEYGALLHNTYTIDLYWFGVIVGTANIILAPYISSIITKLRNEKKINYQRMIVMFALLMLSSLIIQFFLFK